MQIVEYSEWDGSAPALVLNMPNDAYHAHQSISKSGLDRMAISPAHYRFQEPREPSRAMVIGTAIHTALLEPDRFGVDYVLLREVTDRRASAYKEAIKAHDAERVLTGKEADRVSGMQEAVLSQQSARELLLAPGNREASLFVNDPETGVLVRVRYDLLTDTGLAVDLKKTRDARPREFSRSIFNYRYHVQAALYLDAWEWATGEQLAGFRVVAAEELLPHATKVYTLDETAVQDGRSQYRADLNLYAQCLESGDWPAYPCDADEVISLPDWRVAQIENEIAEEIY